MLDKIVSFYFLSLSFGCTTQHLRSYFPDQGWNLCPPGVESQSLNHWTTREVTKIVSYLSAYRRASQKGVSSWVEMLDFRGSIWCHLGFLEASFPLHCPSKFFF